MPWFLRALAQDDLLEHLLYTLETVDSAFAEGTPIEREWAMSEALAVLANVYGSLDRRGSPEVSAHLEAMCDACLSALGDAYTGNPDLLGSAVTFVRAMRTQLYQDAQSRRFAA